MEAPTLPPPAADTDEGRDNILSLVKRRLTLTSQTSSGDLNSGGPPSVVSRPSGGMMGLLKRKDTFKGLAKSITSTLVLRRLTKGKLEPAKPQIKYENTYKMTPDGGRVFDVARVERAAKASMTAIMKDMKYDKTNHAQVSCTLSTLIKNSVKALNMPRYKIVCQVILGKDADQGVQLASRCVWNQKTDNYTCVSHSNGDMFAVAIIHGLYYE